MKSNVKQAQGQNMKRLGVRLEEEEKERKGRHLIIPIIFILVMSEYLLVRLSLLHFVTTINLLIF